jgi:c-di-GMP-binding flagellar brake protein YcgR
MQALSQLENWHDYEVVSRREIIALLRGISEKKQLIRMLINGEADVCVTSILDVDADANALYLDVSVNREQNQRILAANHVLECETSLDKIRIIFGAGGITQADYRGSATLKVTIPESLVRLQRREYYRMPTPVTNPVRAVIPLPPELGGGTQSFPLADISCGGVALLDNNLVLGDSMGRKFENCRIDLPEVGPITTHLQVRNVIDVTLLNNKTNRRLGCEFIDMSRGALGAVQKYITKLERERNARMAGLS